MVGGQDDESEAGLAPTDLVAFFDESKKPVRDRATKKVVPNSEFYVVAGAVVLHGDLDGFRAQVAKLEADLGFTLHYYDLNSRARLTAAVEAIDSIEGWDTYLFETGAPISSARV